MKIGSNSYIDAKNIILGDNISFGNNVSIKCRGTFSLGNHSRIGDNATIEAEEVIIGTHFFHLTPGLTIGGGGSQFPYAKLRVGDRCVFHNNYINLAREINIGNDVGLSPGVQLITHGFWNSPLEGYPCKYGPINIGDGVIVGQNSCILMNTSISQNCVIGANSTVHGTLNIEKGIYAGNPAKLLRVVKEPTEEAKKDIAKNIIDGWHALGGAALDYTYPVIKLNKASINIAKKTIEGEQDDLIDKLRDWLRRHGIKIYTERGFKSL